MNAGGAVRIVAAEVEARLPGPRLRGPVRVFESAGSTNTVAAELARAGAPEGTIVVAEEQTAGRGRLDRRWHSPPGVGLWCSLVLRPRLAPAAQAAVTMVAGLAVAEGVKRAARVPARIKWPNDVLVNGRKVCGILAEAPAGASPAGSGEAALIVGIGVNVNQRAGEFPEELRAHATSLRAARGESGGVAAEAEIDRARLLIAILAAFEPRYDLFLREGLAPHVAEWNDLALWLGEPVRLRVGHGRKTGTFLGLGANGGLQLRTPAGVEEVLAGADLERAV